MSAGSVRGVVFDKDGTLFDFGTTWETWAASFLMRITQGNTDRARAVGQTIGFDLDARRFRQDSVVVAGTAGEVADTLLPHFPHLDAAAMLDLLNAEAGTAPQSEAVPLAPFLTELRARGLVLGVATNDAEAPARAHLDAAGVTAQFDFIAGFDSGFGGKPAPGQLLGFCEAVGLNPETVVMVGDSLHDLHAGRAAGMRTVGVLTGMAPAETLAPFADAVFATIGDLPLWLDRLGAPDPG